MVNALPPVERSIDGFISIDWWYGAVFNLDAEEYLIDINSTASEPDSPDGNYRASVDVGSGVQWAYLGSYECEQGELGVT